MNSCFSTPLLETSGINTPKKKKVEKTLIINSLSNYENKKDIIKKVDNFFQDENKYLDLKQKIFVGKKPSGPKLDNNKNLIYYSLVGDPRLYGRLHGAKQSIKRASAAIKMSENVLSKQKNLIVDVVNNDDLNNLYSDIQKRTKENKEKLNDDYLNDLPNLIKKELKHQEKNLEETKKKNNENLKMENLLIKKTKKKREKLLINDPELYQIKRGILNNIEDKEPIDSKLGVNNWYYNLRRPKKFNGIRDIYINIRSPENPFWGRFFETSPKIISRNRKPIIKAKTFIKDLEKNPYLPKIPHAFGSIEEMKSMNNLLIKGKNLLEFEKNLELNSPGKKKLYNRDQLETFEASQKMSQIEYEKYLTSVTENQVYADDFNVKEYYRLKSGFGNGKSLYSSTEL